MDAVKEWENVVVLFRLYDEDTTESLNSMTSWLGAAQRARFAMAEVHGGVVVTAFDKPCANPIVFRKILRTLVAEATRKGATIYGFGAAMMNILLAWDAGKFVEHSPVIGSVEDALTPPGVFTAPYDRFHLKPEGACTVCGVSAEGSTQDCLIRLAEVLSGGA